MFKQLIRSAHTSESLGADDQSAITVRGLTKGYGSRVLWRGLSFTVPHGQMMALTGPSGAGKSTLLNCLGLLESVDDGQIIVAGVDITRLRAGAARRFRRQALGYLFQNYALMEDATVGDNLDIAVHARRRWCIDRDGHDSALEQVGLGGRAKEKVFRLSGGEQQRVALARLLVKQPSLVLADEPTGALDAKNTTLVIDVLRSMADRGCAVVIATHDPQVEASCDTTVRI